ncbi:hypothetical protein [Lactobacillus pasteurii]|uniref:Uncharacterized protein n=1 Tax=Lactobacillus pasteurii DSM 23907 = CRBIP 24.76 TaxID=1423790 RepID=I7LAY3_9LACO|nr:hypothetical protein [Lactobacillus pasteurii]TDG76683.1 hypothetical protein C5L33_000244 [Lactobacillus pasteurii]CCI85081.1 Protein of unknown function [Lactobacillus pasteurii DSM 23907 = CRBIP 24.76]
MAGFYKNDYFVVAYYILSSSYCELRDNGQKLLCSEFDSYIKNKCNLNDAYYKYIVDSLIDDKLLDHSPKEESGGIVWYYSITPKGIEYIFFDEAMSKAQNYIICKESGQTNEQK